MIVKMLHILHDLTKFDVSDITPHKLIYQLEDKTITKFTHFEISKQNWWFYHRAFLSLGSIHGAPKIQKANCPIRSILALFICTITSLPSILLRSLKCLSTLPFLFLIHTVLSPNYNQFPFPILSCF